MKLVKNARKGISLPEIIAVIIVIAIIGGIALNVISGLATEAKASKAAANVAEMNRLVSLVKASGGSVGAGASNLVDTTSATDAISDLAAGVTLPGTSGVTVQLSPTTANPGSYNVTADGVFSWKGAGNEP